MGAADLALCSCSQRCSVIGGPGSTLLAERPGCSFIRLGFRSLPLCCCIQRGTPFFLAVASVAFWCCSTHRLPPCLCPAQLCTSIIPPAQLDENGSVPTTIITSHAPRTPTLRPPRSCSDSARRADSPWNRAAESSRCLAATSPDAATLSRPSTHLSHQAHRDSRIDTEPSTAPG